GRARGPAEHVHAGVVAGLQQDFAEVFGLGLCQQIDLDADARQHAGDGLTDFLVVDVTIVGAVQRDGEPLGIAGLGQQLFGFGGVGFVGLAVGIIVAV